MTLESKNAKLNKLMDVCAIYGPQLTEFGIEASFLADLKALVDECVQDISGILQPATTLQDDLSRIGRETEANDDITVREEVLRAKGIPQKFATLQEKVQAAIVSIGSLSVSTELIGDPSSDTPTPTWTHTDPALSAKGSAIVDTAKEELSASWQQIESIASNLIPAAQTPNPRAAGFLPTMRLQLANPIPSATTIPSVPPLSIGAASGMMRGGISADRQPDTDPNDPPPAPRGSRPSPFSTNPP